MDFTTLITDRKQSDVDNKTSKGFYNASDFNRVGNAILALSLFFKNIGIDTKVNPKIDYVNGELLEQVGCDNYLQNVQTLRDLITVYESTPTVPTTMNNFWWYHANDIEKILIDISNLLETPFNWQYYFSGEFYSGEV